MEYTCSCGDIPSVHHTKTETRLYCSTCGRESTLPLQAKKDPGTVIPITRASILKKEHLKIEEKKQKKLRDRQDYVVRRSR